MGKFFIIVFDILALGLTGGAYAVHYFSERKLGMVRWVNYHSRAIQDAIPVDVVKIVVLVLVVLVGIILLWRVLASPNRRASSVVQVILSALVILVYAACALFLTHEMSHADTFVVLMTGVGALCALVALAIHTASLASHAGKVQRGRHACH